MKKFILFLFTIFSAQAQLKDERLAAQNLDAAQNAAQISSQLRENLANRLRGLDLDASSERAQQRDELSAALRENAAKERAANRENFAQKKSSLQPKFGANLDQAQSLANTAALDNASFQNEISSQNLDAAAPSEPKSSCDEVVQDFSDLMQTCKANEPVLGLFDLQSRSAKSPEEESALASEDLDAKNAALGEDLDAQNRAAVQNRQAAEQNRQAAEQNRIAKSPETDRIAKSPQPDRIAKSPDEQNILRVALAAVSQALAAGQNEQAHEIAKRLCARRCDDLALNFALIRTGMATGDYDAALAASDRVLIYEPGNFTAHLAAASVYKKQKSTDLLRAELEQMRKLPLNDEQKAAMKSLAASEYALAGELSVGVSNESNAQHLSAESFDYETPIGRVKIPGEDAISASASVVSASVAARRQHSPQTSAVFSLSGYLKRYAKPRKEDFSNIFVLSLGADIAHQMSEKFALNAALNYDYALLKNAPFSHTFALDLALKSQLAPALWLKTGINASAGSYVQAADKNDRYYQLAEYAQLNYYFSRALIYARAQHLREKASASESLNSDYEQFSAALGSSILLSQKLSASLQANYSRSVYDKFHPGFLSARQDEIWRFSSQFEYAFSAAQSLSLGLNYTNANSNQGLYKYENYTASLFYRLKFD